MRPALDQVLPEDLHVVRHHDIANRRALGKRATVCRHRAETGEDAKVSYLIEGVKEPEYRCKGRIDKTEANAAEVRA